MSIANGNQQNPEAVFGAINSQYFNIIWLFMKESYNFCMS